MKSLLRLSLGDRAPFTAFALFFVACALLGGSSRADTAQLLLLRPIIIFYIAFLLIRRAQWAWHPLRILLIMFGLYATIMMVQLIPMPPALWTSLPGHAGFAQAANLQGLAQPWRPISVAPDLTLNSIFALLPAIATILFFGQSTAEQRRAAFIVVLGVVGVSLLFGVLQIASPLGGALYFYRPTSLELPVGLFANRNHQAAFLACGIVVAAGWSCLPAEQRGTSRPGRVVLMPARQWFALALSILFFALILVTGSRSGMAVGLAASMLSIGLILNGRRSQGRRISTRVRVGVGIGGALAIMLMLALFAIVGRASSLSRLASGGESVSELRLTAWPVMRGMLERYFPFGAGFGTFDKTFRMAEPDQLLALGYFNHAHNDILELVLNGGVGMGLLIVGFALWYVMRVRTLWTSRKSAQATQWSIAYVGLSVVLILVLASVTDYPVRTPLLTAFFTLACCWAVYDLTPARLTIDSERRDG